MVHISSLQAGGYACKIQGLDSRAYRSNQGSHHWHFILHTLAGKNAYTAYKKSLQLRGT